MIKRIMALALSLVLVIPALAFAEGTTTQAPLVTGPVLVSQLPLDAALIENSASDDGGYTERLLTSDTYANIVLARRTGAVAADALLAEFYPDATDVTEAEQAPIAAYPAVRYTFTQGANEDTRFGTFVAFSTDTDTFVFAVDVWADAFDDYADMIEWWIEALDVFDNAAPMGLTLTADLPADMEQIGLGTTENGDTTQRYLVYGTAIVTLLQRSEAMTAQEMLLSLYSDAQVVSEEEMEPIDSYPAVRLNFTVGENEDARFGSLVIVATDSYTFAFVAEAPIDQWDGDYSETVQIWIDSLQLIEQ